MQEKRKHNWLFFAAIAAMAFCLPLQAASGAEPTPPAAKEELSRQLKIYKDALLSGSTDQMRSDAATELLMSSDPASRVVLLSALNQDETPAARMAVYRVLVDSRRWPAPLKSTEAFIEPLIEGLRKREGAEAQQIAEATMIFEYRQITDRLKGILDDRSSGVKPRLNAVYALRIRPEKEAISELIGLLDDGDEAVAAAASEALQEWIPIGPDKQVWRGILEDLKKKTREDIVKERLKVLELQKRDLSAKLDTWQKLYLGSLRRMYDGMPDASTRQVFLAEQLASEHSLVKLWGLERVREMSLSEPQLPPDIASRLVSLLTDADPSVRLVTARLLTLKTNVDSTAKLLGQLKVETDENVKAELLSALGAACYYALLPGSQIKLTDEVRSETLEIAAQYLRDKDAKKAARGADVVGKLLEQNGLKAEMMGRYLAMLQQRYASILSENKESSLRLDLLKVMRQLCEAGPQRAEAAGLFGPIFAESMKDGQPAVREVALAGLVAIDKTGAIAAVRQYDLANDAGAAVRLQAVKLAGSVGESQDLEWLVSKLGTAGEGETAWQSMKQIFERSEVNVAVQWVQKCEEMGLVEKIGSAEWLAFLAFIEQRVGNGNGGKLANEMRQKLAQLYRDRQEYGNAASYYKLLAESAADEEKDSLTAMYVEMCLKGTSPDAMKAVTAVVAERVSGDPRPRDVVLARIEEYLAGNPGAEKVKTVLDALGRIKGNTVWQETLAKWQKQYPPSDA
jgi:hypothetical protein